MKDSFKDLVKKMDAKDTTHQWDVLVSYDEDKVNELLQANPISIVENFPVFTGSALAENEDDEMEERNPYGLARVIGDLRGTYKQVAPRSREAKPVPDGYQLAIDVDLFNVAGTLDNKIPKSSPSKLERVRTNYVVGLGEDPDATRNICLSFENAKGTILGGPAEKKKKLTAAVSEALRDGLETALRRDIKDHFITGVTRRVNDPNLIVLQPTSFCFSVIPREPNNVPGTLLMWIGVRGGPENGKKPSGQTILSFEPDGKAACPIPESCSASIIFSHDLMARAFFAPNLANAFDDLKVTSTKGVAGITFTGKLKSGGVEIEKFTDKLDTYAGWRFCHCDGLGFKTDTPTTDITVKSGIVTSSEDAVLVSYTSKPQTANWSTETTIYPPGGVPTTTVIRGAVDLTFSWKSRGKWEGGNDTYPNLLQLKFTDDPKWVVKYKGEEPNWWQNLLGLGGTVPKHYTRLEVPAPKVNLEMKALEYFLTTNLLFPGKHVFHAHPLTVENKDKKGLAVPRDLILTGDIKMAA